MNERRQMLEQHVATLNALMRGGISKGFSKDVDVDPIQGALRAQWDTQRNLLKRVLAEPGDPMDRLLEWRERTEGFLDKYPERSGWTDREGIVWNAKGVLEAIDKLQEQVEGWEMEEEEFDEDEGGE